MSPRLLFGAVILISLISLIHSSSSSGKHKSTSASKVLLRSVEVITLYHGKKTTGRRSSPVPQLTLMGGSAANAVRPLDVVQCYNRGFDGYDVQWECFAHMPVEVKFGYIDVSCEGFDYPNDPYVLKGSCGLSYTLDYAQSNNYDKSYYQPYGNLTGSSYEPFFIFIAVTGVVYFVYKLCLAPQTETSGQTTLPPSYEESSNTGPRRNRIYSSIQLSSSGIDPSASHTENNPEYGWANNVVGTGSGTASESRTQTIFDTPAESQSDTQTNTNNNTNGFGFWSGIVTGVLMLFLFGDSRGPVGRGRGGGFVMSSGFGGTSRR